MSQKGIAKFNLKSKEKAKGILNYFQNEAIISNAEKEIQ